MQDTKQEKPGFLNYLGSFFTGWLFKDLIEDELRVATKTPKIEPVSLRELVKGATWKEIKAGWKEIKAGLKKTDTLKAFGKDVGKDVAIHGASIVPGALLGYVVLKPVVSQVESAFKSVSGKTPETIISDTELQNKITTPSEQIQK